MRIKIFMCGDDSVLFTGFDLWAAFESSFCISSLILWSCFVFRSLITASQTLGFVSAPPILI